MAILKRFLSWFGKDDAVDAVICAVCGRTTNERRCGFCRRTVCLSCSKDQLSGDLVCLDCDASV